ncbi:MAG: hypothetical protein OZ921_03360 [Sorangiineae bacterium]|nr:hypothetical protein [Polyangiaceae bacterium]MEB2321527.1 hypothetical protein [Sorangiineae bacterium]
MTRLVTSLLIALSAVAAPSFAGAAPEPAAPPADSRGGADSGASPKPEPKAPVAVEVTVLHATNSKRGIDKRIGDMPELKKPPFSSYDSYELLSRERLPLVKGDAKDLRLPNGRVLQSKLLEILPKDTFRISASINKPGGKTFLPLLEVKAHLGQAFIVAGQSYKNGILVLVIRVTR